MAPHATAPRPTLPRRAPRLVRPCSLVALAVLGFCPTRATAQPATGDPEAVEAGERPATLADGTRRVRGQVRIQDGDQGRGAAGAWVVLHRVSPAVSGPLDSVRTDPRGGYAFRYRPDTVANALYFATVSHAGLAYMTPPLREAVVEGEAADIAVFDTTSAAVPITVRGRHVIVRADSGGRREVQEVYEITNDSTVAAVAATGASGSVWSVPLPAGVSDFRVRGGIEMADDGMVAVGGRAVLVAPLPPGLKQLAFRYSVPAETETLSFAVEHATDLLEVLLAESSASASAPGLRMVDSVATDEGRFRRYLAQNVRPGASLAVVLAAGAGRSGVQRTLPLVFALLGGAGALALVASRRRAGRERLVRPLPGTGRAARPSAQPAVEPSGAPPAERERLLGALAALDDAFAARPQPTEVDRATYERERAVLKARLGALLTGSPSPP